MNTTREHPGLLPLAFGDSGKTRLTGTSQVAEMLGRSGYRLLDLAAENNRDPLVVEAASVSLASVTLLAVSSLAHRVITARAGRVSLCFGVEGSGTLTIDRSVVTYHRAAGALIPERPVEWRIPTAASDFEVSFDRTRLTTTARTMLGLDDEAELPGWNIDELRPVPAKVGVVDAFATLLGLAIQADRYHSQPRVLDSSGIEDQCYRQAVFLLLPDAFQRIRGLPPAGIEGGAVDRLCDWLRANLSSATTLTDMERFSGLAARTLQVSFLKRFECSPMAWLREQRLLAARAMLEHSREQEPATALDAAATSCGFGTAAKLKKRYRARFGESPADTLGRRGNSASERMGDSPSRS
jgi:AraC-like DNA-binding protein